MSDCKCKLVCGHEVIFDIAPPTTGTLVYCFRCEDYRIVTEGRTEYVVRCLNCRYSRRFGAARVNAELGATNHHQRKPAHVVELRKGNEVLHRFGEVGTTLRLDHASEIPPF